jgi:hypothetical protein
MVGRSGIAAQVSAAGRVGQGEPFATNALRTKLALDSLKLHYYVRDIVLIERYIPMYDFKQLSPYDFENLSRDLLQVAEGVRFESFKTGRDNGIDFRYADASKFTSIIQCKHYVTTGFAGLVRDLKREVQNVHALNPNRYILVTSVGLTPANKEIIRSMFGTLLASKDIIGQDDLNNLLGQYPEIEKKHYKLWLTSRAVLDRVLHNAVATQSEFEVEKVYEDIRRYVPSAAYSRALDILGRDHVVIISGQPGVGKTTLAKMLLYQHLESGFEAVSILTDFQTAREKYRAGAKQIFYFDDFMGSTFLGDKGPSFTRNEDRSIIDFIEMVRRSPTARLILTTREHIFRQAFDLSEKIRNSSILDHRCVLELADYSFRQRATILYNHLYFSDLPSEYRDALLDDDFYLEIVRHEKFNPRLIEWLSSYRRVRSIAPSEYRAFIRNLLHDPSEIWRHAYEKQISDAGRSQLLALYSLQGKAPVHLLKRAFVELHRHRAHKYGFRSKPEDMQLAFTELNGSFLKPAGSMIEVINPSVLDLVNAIVRGSPENALDIIQGAIRFEQLSRVWTFSSDPKGETVRQTIIDNASHLPDAIERLLNAPRKIDLGKGSAGYTDTSLERRLAVLIDIANATRSAPLRQLILPFVENIVAIWQTERVNIEDALSAIGIIRQRGWAVAEVANDLEKRLLLCIIDDARGGCTSSELRELASLISENNPTPFDLEPLRDAFKSYLDEYFTTELRECRSTADFEGLIDELDLIAHYTKINVSVQITKIRAEADEFEEHKSRYEDHMHDEWKDRWRDHRSDERSVRDMFSSLTRK